MSDLFWIQLCRVSVFLIAGFPMSSTCWALEPDLQKYMNQAVEDAVSDGDISNAEIIELLTFGPAILSPLKQRTDQYSILRFYETLKTNTDSIRSGSDKEAIAAARYFGNWKADRFVVLALTHPDFTVRGEAGRLLSDMGTTRVFSELLAAYKWNGRDAELEILTFDSGFVGAAIGYEKDRIASILRRILKAEKVQVPKDANSADQIVLFCEKWWIMNSTKYPHSVIESTK